MSQSTRDAVPEAIKLLELNGKGGAKEFSPAEHGQNEASDSMLWVHVDFSEAEGVNWLRHDEALDDTIVSALVEDDSRPRTLLTDCGVLTILRGINFNPGEAAEDMISVRIWVEENRVVTASRRHLKTINDIRDQLNGNRGPRSPQTLFIEIVDRLEYYVGEFIERIEETLETVESDVNASITVVKNSPFSVLRRQTARIRRYLSPQRDALEKIARSSQGLFDQDQLFELREHVNRFTLLLEDLDLIRERAIVAQEEFLGNLAHEQNYRMFVLSIVAAIFLPLSFLTGLMGMNVAGLPGTVNDGAFNLLVVLMALISVMIMAIFKIKKWF